MPSVSGCWRMPVTELATVICSPSRIQAAPRPATIRVWNGDQLRRSRRAGMVLRIGRLIVDTVVIAVSFWDVARSRDGERRRGSAGAPYPDRIKRHFPGPPTSGEAAPYPAALALCPLGLVPDGRRSSMDSYDVITIGTGAGGGPLARHLAPSGKRILLLERGDWLPREPSNWLAQDVFVDNRYVSPDTWYHPTGQPFH